MWNKSITFAKRYRVRQDGLPNHLAHYPTNYKIDYHRYETDSVFF